MLTEVFHTLVLQSHAVQHTTGSLCHTRIVITLTRFQRRTFHDDATQTAKVYKVLKLKAIAKCTTGRHHWVLQCQRTYIDS